MSASHKYAGCVCDKGLRSTCGVWWTWVTIPSTEILVKSKGRGILISVDWGMDGCCIYEVEEVFQKKWTVWESKKEGNRRVRYWKKEDKKGLETDRFLDAEVNSHSFYFLCKLGTTAEIEMSKGRRVRISELVWNSDCGKWRGQQ